MDIKENRFYRKINITEALGIYPQFKDFAGNNDEYVTLKGGMGATSYILSGSTPPVPIFGEGELSNGYLRCLASSANLSNAATIPNVEVYKVKKGIPITEGGMLMATDPISLATRDTTPGEDLYVAGAYLDGETVWHEESFDGSDKSIGKVIPIRSIGTSNVTFEDAYLDRANATSEIFIGGGKFPGGGGNKNKNLKDFFSDPNNKNNIPVKPVNPKKFRGRWTVKNDRRSKKQQWEIYAPFWKFKDIKGYLNFAKTEPVSTTIETTVAASKNNTIFDEIKMTPNQNNPFTFNTTTQPLIYSTVELTSAKKATEGQALRIYHNWSHVSNVDDRKRVEGLFAPGVDQESTNPDHVPALPQVAMLRMSNIPRPAAIDMGYQGKFPYNPNQSYDYGAALPEINFRMNIAKLGHNLPCSLAQGTHSTPASFWTTQNNDQQPYINIWGPATYATGNFTYGWACGLNNVAAGGTGPTTIQNNKYMGKRDSDSFDTRNFTYQRGIVMVLSTRKPEQSESTLDIFLKGLYDDDETFGGVQFMSYSNPLYVSGLNLGDMGWSANLPSAPGGGPWNDGSLAYVDATSVWIKPIPIVPNVDDSTYNTGSLYPQLPVNVASDASGSFASNGGLGSVHFERTATTADWGVDRLKVLYNESPGYWLDGKEEQISGPDDGSNDGKWSWSTKNWARVLKDSWFNMKLVFNPFVSCSAQQQFGGGAKGTRSSGINTYSEGIAVRAYFETDFDIKTAQTATTSAEFDDDPGSVSGGPTSDANVPSKKFVPFVNIPMFNKARAERDVSLGGFALIDEDYWPRHITFWFMNYRWAGGINTPTGETEQLWLMGDDALQPNGGDMELEAYFDNISFKHWNTEMDNASVGRGPITSMLNIKNYSVITPQRNALGYQGSYGSGFLNSGCFTNASTGYNILIGLKEKRDLPYTDPAGNYTASGGFFLFNGFSTQQFKNMEPLFPTMSCITKEPMTFTDSDLEAASYGFRRLGNQLGPGFQGYETSGTYINWNSASYSGTSLYGAGTTRDIPSGNFPTSGGTPAIDNMESGFYNTSGLNNYRSVDGFSQKGLGAVLMTDDSTVDWLSSAGSKGKGGTKWWAKREHILASARIIGVPSADAAGSSGQDTTRNYISVDKPEIFNIADPDEEYVIYRHFQPITSGQMNPTSIGANFSSVSRGWKQAGLSGSLGPLKLAETGARDGDTFYFDCTNIMLADDSSTMMDGGVTGITDLWISPKRYWIHMAFGSALFPEIYTKPLLTPRIYESVAMLNYSSSADLTTISGGTDLGTTYDEFYYTYASGEQAQKGKSQVYQRAWSLMPEEDSDLELTKDYGFGVYDSEKNEGGQLGVQPALINTGANPNRYIEFPLSGLVRQDKPAGSEDILFKMGLVDEMDSSDVIIYGDEYSGVADYKPHLIWEYKDELPKLSEFVVEPAASVLDKDVNLYELTTEPLNSIKFSWTEDAEDIWYRMLFIDTGSISNKYHNTKLHIPLNEGPTTIGSGATNTWYDYTTTTIGTGTVSTTGSGFKADIEGLAGYCMNYNSAAANEGFSFISGHNNTSVSGTDYTVVVHAIPTVAPNGELIFSYATGTANGMNISLEADGKIKARHLGTVLTGTSIVPTDGETPVSVIVVHKNSSSDGKDLKLYVNGALEDYYGGTLANISVSSATAIGGEYTLGSGMFRGKVEEVVVYNTAIRIPENDTDLIVNTEDLSYNVDASSVYQSRLFAFDYHNIRGRGDTEVASTNQIAWKVTTV